MIEGVRVLTMNTGEKLYEVMGNVFPEMRDGKLTEEEYQGIEDGIRTQVQFYLQQLKEHYKQAPGLFEVIYWSTNPSRFPWLFGRHLQVHARRYLAMFTTYAEQFLEEVLEEMEEQDEEIQVIIDSWFSRFS